MCVQRMSPSPRSASMSSSAAPRLTRVESIHRSWDVVDAHDDRWLAINALLMLDQANCHAEQDPLPAMVSLHTGCRPRDQCLGSATALRCARGIRRPMLVAGGARSAAAARGAHGYFRTAGTTSTARAPAATPTPNDQPVDRAMQRMRDSGRSASATLWRRANNALAPEPSHDPFGTASQHVHVGLKAHSA
jgi:hypothetical protein